MDLKDKVAELLEGVSSFEEVRAIGRTGDIDMLPIPGETDIDIFLLCDSIPGYDERKEIYDRNSFLFEQCFMNVCEGGNWGTGDVFIINGVETMLMYFCTEESLDYVNEVLEGKHLEKINGFYPVGRCATFKNINIIYDEAGILHSLKEKLSTYPENLKDKMLDFHLGIIKDEEDFGRALRRKDVLFFHQVIEASIDHYLQALYALNKTYFPSRKRTRQYIDSFKLKPEYCYERLLEVISLGSCSDGLEKAYNEWCSLVDDLRSICKAESKYGQNG